jgi:hypothetical protein
VTVGVGLKTARHPTAEAPSKSQTTWTFESFPSHAKIGKPIPFGSLALMSRCTGTPGATTSDS